MANKNVNKNSSAQIAAAKRRALEKQERKLQYEEACGKQYYYFLTIFAASLAIGVVMLIVLLCRRVAYNYAIGSGAEQWITGGRIIGVLFKGNWTDISDDSFYIVYTYAKAWCIPLGAVTLVTAVLFVIGIVIFIGATVYTVTKKDYLFSWIALIGSVLTTVSAVALYAIALSMNASDLYVLYCNPAVCTMYADTIWCVILSLAILAGNIIAVIKYTKLERILRPANAKTREAK